MFQYNFYFFKIDFRYYYIPSLTLSPLGRIFSRQHIEILFLRFLHKTGLDILCKLSPMKTTCLNYQILFSGSNKTIITNLSSAELAQRVVKDKNIKRVASSIPYLTYTFGETSLSSKYPDQPQQNAASDQGLHFLPIGLEGSVGSASNWWSEGRVFDRRVRQNSFIKIDHEIFSTVILSLPLIK